MYVWDTWPGALHAVGDAPERAARKVLPLRQRCTGRILVLLNVWVCERILVVVTVRGVDESTAYSVCMTGCVCVCVTGCVCVCVPSMLIELMRIQLKACVWICVRERLMKDLVEVCWFVSVPSKISKIKQENPSRFVVYSFSEWPGDFGQNSIKEIY